MEKKITANLIALGLSDKESALYYSALKLGPATAQRLSLESGIKRATVYGCIDSLIAKGLFHIEVKGTRKLYVPETPEKLSSLLDQKKQLLAEIMPQLVQNYMHSAASSSNAIKIYQGLNKIKLVYDQILETLKEDDEYLVISDQQKWHALDANYFEEFIKKRASMNLIIKIILQDTAHAKKYKEKEDQYNEKIKMLPKHIELNTNMVILPNKVIIVQTVEPLMAIVIENVNIAAMNKTLFHTIWSLI